VQPFDAIPETGTKVNALLVLCGHRSWNRREEQWRDDSWRFWRVVAFSESEKPVCPTSLPLPNPENNRHGSKWFYVDSTGRKLNINHNDMAALKNAMVFREVTGFVVNTGKMIEQKHDERLFFGPD